MSFIPFPGQKPYRLSTVQGAEQDKSKTSDKWISFVCISLADVNSFQMISFVCELTYK